MRSGLAIKYPCIDCTYSRAVSLQTVSFGRGDDKLRQMARVARDMQQAVRVNPNRYVLLSSYAEALDSVCSFFIMTLPAD